MAHGARWSDDIRAAVGEQLRAGRDDTAIAASLGVGRPTVAKERKRLGLAPIAARWGERPHVKRGPSAMRRVLEPRFAELYEARLSDARIAAALGCDKNIVFLWRRAIGLAGAALYDKSRRPRLSRPPRPQRLRVPCPTLPPFGPISAFSNPLWAAAMHVARQVAPECREDVASELVIAVLSGNIERPTIAAARRLARRCRGPRHHSLDAPRFAGDRGTWIDNLIDPSALEAFEVIA